MHSGWCITRQFSSISTNFRIQTKQPSKQFKQSNTETQKQQKINHTINQPTKQPTKTSTPPETNELHLKIAGWNTILSFWVSAYCQVLCLLVLGRVTKQRTKQTTTP